MRECYSQLYQVNEEMLRNHKLYCNNHEQLLAILRKLNLIIQHASRLRGIYQMFTVIISLQQLYEGMYKVDSSEIFSENFNRVIWASSGNFSVL